MARAPLHEEIHVLAKSSLRIPVGSSPGKIGSKRFALIFDRQLLLRFHKSAAILDCCSDLHGGVFAVKNIIHL
jgi:hypothetical protein